MTDVLKMSRKALTIGVVLTTILWSMMATVLVAPLKASAAGCTSGSLIKGSLAAVYYCGADMKRYVFTNDKAYWTWYPDFSGVMNISDADLASIQIGGNATYRPGVKMIKIQTDPKVYAISHGGVLRPIASEAVAVALYGATWNKMIDDISDAFFTNYSVGTPINAAADFDKTAEMSGSQSINQDKGLSTTTVSGALSVSLASDNPASATVPKAATGVNMLKFNVRNGGATAGTVDTITVHRAGPGNATDLESVYLYEGNTRLTTGRSVNGSTNDSSFSGLNLLLAPGQTRTLWVAVDIADGNTVSSGNVHMMGVTHVLSGTMEASGEPVYGNNFTIASASVGSLTIARTGSITNPKLGEMGAKVAEFTIGAGSAEDVNLTRLTLYQGGNLSAANLTNLTLWQAGLMLSTAATLDSNLHATFEMPAGFHLDKGQTKTFQVKADIGGGARSGDTLRLYVEENSDLHGVGGTYGYGVTVIRTDYDGGACGDNTGDCSGSHVEAGQVTIGFSGPSSMNVATNGKDVEILHFTIVTQSNIEVRHLKLMLDASASAAGNSGLICEANQGTCGTTSTANYTDVKITNVKTGTNWWGPSDVSVATGASDSSQSLSFNDVWTLQAGQSYEFKVTADVSSKAMPGDNITATLSAFNDNDLRNLDNNTFLVIADDVVPSGNIVGNPMSILAPGLTASRSSTPVSQSYVKGTQNIDFVGLNLKSGDASAITVNEVDATGVLVGSGNFKTDVNICRLMDNGVAIPGVTSEAPATNGTMNFTNLNLSVISGATKSLKINCDTTNSAVANNKDSIKITGVTAQDPDGNSVVVSDNAFVPVAISAGNPVNGVPDTFVTILPSGSMTYAASPPDGESEAGIVIAGLPPVVPAPATPPPPVNVVLGKIKLTAANEALKQTKLRVSLVNAASANSVVSMSLWDGATMVAGPVSLSGANADFSVAAGIITVPKDDSRTLTVKAVLNSISEGATSGADLTIKINLSAIIANTFEFRGTNSSTVATTLSGTNTDVLGEQKILRKTKLTVSNASMSTVLNDGDQVLSHFTLTADGANQADVKTITFNLSMAALTSVSNFTLKDSSGNIRPATILPASCSSTCAVAVTFTTEEGISSGGSKTYELHGDVLGTGSSSSISTSLKADSASPVNVTGELEAAGTKIDGLTGSASDTAAYNFIWSDNSDVHHNAISGSGADNASPPGDAAASNDWTNGLYIKVLPNQTQSLNG